MAGFQERLGTGTQLFLTFLTFFFLPPDILNGKGKSQNQTRFKGWWNGLLPLDGRNCKIHCKRRWEEWLIVAISVFHSRWMVFCWWWFCFFFFFSWIFLGYFIIFLFQKDVFKRHLKNNFAFFFSVQEGFLIIASISVFCDNVNFLLQCEFWFTCYVLFPCCYLSLSLL